MHSKIISKKTSKLILLALKSMKCKPQPVRKPTKIIYQIRYLMVPTTGNKKNFICSLLTLNPPCLHQNSSCISTSYYKVKRIPSKLMTPDTFGNKFLSALCASCHFIVAIITSSMFGMQKDIAIVELLNVIAVMAH